MHVLLVGNSIFFFKQKTAYEMRISDWSSDVCSSELHFVALPDFTILHLEIRHDAAEGVEHGIEYQRLQGRFRIAHRRWHAFHNGLEDIQHPEPGLTQSRNDIFPLATEQINHRVFYFFAHGPRKDHLIHHRV